MLGVGLMVRSSIFVFSPASRCGVRGAHTTGRGRHRWCSAAQAGGESRASRRQQIGPVSRCGVTASEISNVSHQFPSGAPGGREEGGTIPLVLFLLSRGVPTCLWVRLSLGDRILIRNIVSLYVCMSVFMYVCEYVCTYVCVYVWVITEGNMGSPLKTDERRALCGSSIWFARMRLPWQLMIGVDLSLSTSWGKQQ